MPNEVPLSEEPPAGSRTSPNEVPLSIKQDVDLPITARRDEIVEALERHPVLILAGETGSGKSTQLPQYCLAAGRGRAGLIAHTQPRRLAARALAARIAEEIAQPVGLTVGFQVRFADQISKSTRLVLMTDGLLLAGLSKDPFLRRYDTIIVDEAHERSLNVDLLLGVIKRILPHRPDLRVIVTSATLEVERISKFFDHAPTIAVSGRGYPIEVRYAAPALDEGDAGDEDPDLPTAVLAAYREIAATPAAGTGRDVLVFLPGEREIRDVAELLERELPPTVDVLALFSRQSWEQQSRIFARGTRPRIVLATNVAETSITVPGIRAVIDSGLARISRYSPRNRLQRLPIERISRASADQRKGRCGRLGPGLCLRLYPETDFEERARFTEPEVLRTNLAALLLRLAADGLGDAEDFPFIDAPDARALADGYRVLQELEALDPQRRITRRGRAMARLPLDPKLARALLESKRFRAEEEILAIVSALSVPDPRLADGEGRRPDESARRGPDESPSPLFEDSKSEFSALVRLWRAYRKMRQGPRRELRRWCKERRLSLLRLSEWEDVYDQVVDRAREIGIVAAPRAASYAGVHRALLAGFCTLVGVRSEDGLYLGTRGVRFHIFPGSPLRRRKPRWVMAAYLVETSRVFARRVAEVEPMWIEGAVRHLSKREFLEPDWNEEREEVVARERVSFLGLTLSDNRVVNFGPIAPEESRMIFAREALVYRRLHRRPDWLLANDAALRAAERLEERLRVRGLVQPAEAFVEFYATALPRQVSSAATLEHFTRHLAEPERAKLLLRKEQIFARSPDPEALAQFPETVRMGTLTCEVEYRFAPGDATDGATLRVPLLALPTLTRAAVDQAIPGLVAPRIVALLRSLPKDARRTLIPIGAAAAEYLGFKGLPSTDPKRLAEWLQEVRGVPSSLVRFEAGQVPAHLVAQIEVIADGIAPGSGSDVAELRRRFARDARRALAEETRRRYPSPWRRFEAEELPARVEIPVEGGHLDVFPTLARNGDAAQVRFEWSAAESAFTFRQGAAHLARTMLEPQAHELEKSIRSDARLTLGAAPYLSGKELAQVLGGWAFSQACFGTGEAPRSRPAFETAVDRGRAALFPALDESIKTLAAWFAEARAVRRLLEDPRASAHGAAAAESQAHLAALLSAAALDSMPELWLRQIPRYLKAEERRWQRLLARGSEPMQTVRELSAWAARRRSLELQVAAELRILPELTEFGFWIEEYRVSLYAQELKTLGPVSAARLEQRAAEIEAWIAR